MRYLLAYPVAFGAALPTVLAVLALWIAHARLVEGNRAETVFLPFVFLFVPLIFFVASAGNLLAVAIGQVVGLAAPALERVATIAAAGVLVWAGCAWTQRGSARHAPVSALPVALFALADMLFLAGGLSLLPGQSSF